LRLLGRFILPATKAASFLRLLSTKLKTSWFLEVFDEVDAIQALIKAIEEHILFSQTNRKSKQFRM